MSWGAALDGIGLLKSGLVGVDVGLLVGFGVEIVWFGGVVHCCLGCFFI